MKLSSPRKPPAGLPLPEKEKGKAGRIAQSDRKPTSTQGERAEATLTLTLRPGKDGPTALLRAIRTEKERIKRALARVNCPDERENLLRRQADIAALEMSECGIGKKPSRPDAKELGFLSPTPTSEEIIERAVIQRCLKQNRFALILPKLAAMNPGKWGGELKREENYCPQVRRAKHRISAGEIAGEYVDQVEKIIAENWFSSARLKKPLREYGFDKAVVELSDKLGVRLSVQAYGRKVSGLFLTG